MNDKVRICCYCEKWQVGGIQNIQVNLLKYMPSDRISIDIAASEDDTDFYDRAIEAAGARKLITLDKIYSSPGVRTVNNLLGMARLFRAGKYDAVHFNVCHAVELIYVFIAKLSGVPVRIVHCRNNDIGSGGRSRKLKILAHNICKHVFAGTPTARIANSDLAAEWLFPEKYIRAGKVRILNNGIEASRYSFNAEKRAELRRKRGLDGSFVVGHVGHFNYQKNHEFLLKVFKAVLERVPEAVLVLVGEGALRPQIEELAAELGIVDRIIFWGVTDNVPEVMWLMDTFVLPSHFEGFGNVLIEAQAAGLRCFASKDVIPERVQVTELVSWLPLSENAEYWGAAITEAAEPYDRVDHVREVIENGYDISNMAEELIKIYLRK